MDICENLKNQNNFVIARLKIVFLWYFITCSFCKGACICFEYLGCFFSEWPFERQREVGMAQPQAPSTSTAQLLQARQPESSLQKQQQPLWRPPADILLLYK